MLDPHGRVEFATDGARRLLGDTHANRRGFPDEVRDWLSTQDNARVAAEPLILEIAGNSVLVRRLPSRRDDHREVLLLENGTGQLSIDALRGLGLTAREAETLFWTALGHSVSETAAELGVARRTIQKHLQHVYEKLGVRSASQAAATAWAAVGVRPTPA